MGLLWVAVQVHRQLLPALLGASPILRDFDITADRAGLLAAIYFPIYGLMQVPSGLVADRGALRRLLVGSCLFLALAGVAFALAPTLGLAIVARALVAVASSLFWVPGLKLCLQLAPRRYGRSVGVLVAAGSVGGVAALIPGSYLCGWIASRAANGGRPLFHLAQVGSLVAVLALVLIGPRFGPLPLFFVAGALGAFFGAFFIYMSLLARDVPTARLGAA